jgi:serine/threonine-protein kinase
MIGTTLSHFRITAKLGEGGMGEVWRAEDTTLGREVAVKVLPERFTAEPERLARFQREARVLAAFSHANIAQIHEVGAEGERTFLVMELAAGETLADRIARGPVPPAEAVPIALQIAEALEAAHERGIVHRDLKPANVKVDAEGRVKVLDFGLARALDPEPGSDAAQSLANSPTLTLGATVAGMLMGTAAYMSPEQAAGRPADRRADVWAFGVVLMEMLLGHQVFAGESVSHVLAGVLKDEPSWEELPDGLSPRLRRLLERCLRKKPRERLQAMGDARVALEEILTDPEADEPPGSAAAAAATPTGTRQWLPWAVAAVATLAALGLLWRSVAMAPAQAGSAPWRVELPLPSGTLLDLDHQYDALVLSPDGRRQVFRVKGAGDRDPYLVLRDLGELEGRRLPDTEGAASPFFSPDGEWIGFFAQGRLWRMPTAGGPRSLIAQAEGDNRGATWSSDGHIYATPNTGMPLQRVRETGGAFEAAMALDGERSERTQRWPHALPGGSAVLFTSDDFASTEYYDDARIEALVPATGERRVLVEQASRAWFLAPDRLLFARGGALFAVPFDPETLATSGSPVVVLQGVQTTVASGAVHLSVARDGTLLYVAGEVSHAAASVLWVDREGTVEPGDVALGAIDQLALSPDGQRVVLVTVEGGTRVLWVADLVRGTRTRLTFEEFASDPVWSPDGQWIAYNGPDGLSRKRADGTGEPERLLESERPTYGNSFSPDGRTLVFSPDSESGQGDIFALSLDGGGPPTPVVQTPANEWMAELSPDGRWLAYSSMETGRPEVYVRPFGTEGGRWQASADTGFEPHWSRDGTELFYRDGLGSLFSIPVETSPAFALGLPVRLFGGLRTGTNSATYAVAPDGTRFLILGLTTDQTVDRLSFVQGWGAEVARLTAPR